MKRRFFELPKHYRPRKDGKIDRRVADGRNITESENYILPRPIDQATINYTGKEY